MREEAIWLLTVVLIIVSVLMIFLPYLCFEAQNEADEQRRVCAYLCDELFVDDLNKPAGWGVVDTGDNTCSCGVIINNEP